MKKLENSTPLPDDIDWNLAEIRFSIPYKAEEGYYVVFLRRSLHPMDTVAGHYLIRGTKLECETFLNEKKR